MTALFLALVLATSSAAAPCPDCPKTPAPKVYKGDFKCKPGLVKEKCGNEIRCVPPAQAKAMRQDREAEVAQAQQPKPPPPEVATAPAAIVPPVVVVPPVVAAIKPQQKSQPKPSGWSFSVLGEVGETLSCRRGYEGLLGFRERYAPLHLGVQGYTLFRYGLGAEALVYPLQYDHFRLHLQGGVLFHEPDWALSVKTIRRSLDWNVGMGADFPIDNHFEFVVDLNRYSPFGTPSGYDGGKVFTHATEQALLLAGVKLRF